MMMIKLKKKFIIYSSICIILISLIIVPQYAFNSAKEGLLLWFNIIIPSLLPFIIISNLIIKLGLVKYISAIFSPIMKRLFHLPGAAGYAYLLGMLSGYPMGAKITADLFEKKYLTKNQAQYLLAFCNNASPMFVLGFVSVGVLNVGHIGFYLLIILYVSSFITGMIFRFIYQPNINSIKKTHKYSSAKSYKTSFKIFDECIIDAIDLIVRIGGYVIFFSIILSLIAIIPFAPEVVKNFVLGFIEVSNGINLVAKTNTLLEIKIILVNTLISFGGFSIHAQTANVISNTPLSIKHYLLSKCINAFITFFLTLFFFILI